MKRLLLPLLATLALPSAVNANLDDYLVGSPNRRSWDDIYCGYNLEADNYIKKNRGKECTITISDSKIIINNEYSIEKESIIHKIQNRTRKTAFGTIWIRCRPVTLHSNIKSLHYSHSKQAP